MLKRYSRACGSYQVFIDRGLLLTRKLLNQGFLLVKLKSSLRKSYGNHHDLVDRYRISVSQMTTEWSSPPVFNGVRVTRSLVLCVSFVDRFVLFRLSVPPKFRDSDYPFGIFKFFLLIICFLENK